MIYFITQQDRYVKIGYTDSDAPGRLASLQTGNPFPLSIIKIIDGSQQDEHDIHARFNDIRIIGEWFYLTNQLLRYIDSLQPCKDIIGDMRQAANKLNILREQHQVQADRIDKTVLFNLLDRLVDRFS